MLLVILIGAMLSFQRPEPLEKQTSIEADKKRRVARKHERGRCTGAQMFRHCDPPKIMIFFLGR